MPRQILTSGGIPVIVSDGDYWILRIFKWHIDNGYTTGVDLAKPKGNKFHPRPGAAIAPAVFPLH